MPACHFTPIKCEHCAVRHEGLCGVLTSSYITQLSSMAASEHHDKGSVVHFEGDRAGSLASVVEGSGKLTQTLEDGREQIVGLIFPGDLIAPDRLSNGRHHFSYSLTALQPLTLCRYPIEPFLALSDSVHPLARKLHDMARAEVAAAREWITMLGCKSARERVATFLVYFLNRIAPSSGKALLPLTRAEIAELTGLTLETVSRQFSRFQREGVITLGSSRLLAQVDLERLQALTGRIPLDAALLAAE
jgi:CRP/FNR family transcriptional regulator, anaerobic regulatory protein